MFGFQYYCAQFPIMIEARSWHHDDNPIIHNIQQYLKQLLLNSSKVKKNLFHTCINSDRGKICSVKEHGQFANLLGVFFDLILVFMITEWMYKFYRSGVETLPHNAKAHYNFANFLKDVGRDKEAMHHYQTALRWVSNVWVIIW